eukprot:7114763-Pyramimonas_sp.AAC.1
MGSAGSAQRCRRARPGDGQREDAAWKQSAGSRGAVEERECARHRGGEHGVCRKLRHAGLPRHARAHQDPRCLGGQL